MPPDSSTPNEAWMFYPFEDFCLLEKPGTFIAMASPVSFSCLCQGLLDSHGGVLLPTSFSIFPLAECLCPPGDCALLFRQF